MDYKVTIGGKVYEYPEGTSYQTIAKDFQKEYQHDIVLASVNHKLQELGKKLSSDCELSFLTTDTFIGQQTYRRSMTLLLMKAVYKVVGHDRIHRAQVQYSLSNGYYCTLEGDFLLNEELLEKIKEKM